MAKKTKQEKREDKRTKFEEKSRKIEEAYEKKLKRVKDARGRVAELEQNIRAHSDHLDNERKERGKLQEQQRKAKTDKEKIELQKKIDECTKNIATTEPKIARVREDLKEADKELKKASAALLGWKMRLLNLAKSIIMLPVNIITFIPRKIIQAVRDKIHEASLSADGALEAEAEAKANIEAENAKTRVPSEIDQDRVADIIADEKKNDLEKIMGIADIAAEQKCNTQFNIIDKDGNKQLVNIAYEETDHGMDESHPGTAGRVRITFPGQDLDPITIETTMKADPKVPEGVQDFSVKQKNLGKAVINFINDGTHTRANNVPDTRHFFFTQDIKDAISQSFGGQTLEALSPEQRQNQREVLEEEVKRTQQAKEDLENGSQEKTSGEKTEEEKEHNRNQANARQRRKAEKAKEAEKEEGVELVQFKFETKNGQTVTITGLAESEAVLTETIHGTIRPERSDEFKHAAKVYIKVGYKDLEKTEYIGKKTGDMAKAKRTVRDEFVKAGVDKSVLEPRIMRTERETIRAVQEYINTSTSPEEEKAEALEQLAEIPEYTMGKAGLYETLKTMRDENTSPLLNQAVMEVIVEKREAAGRAIQNLTQNGYDLTEEEPRKAREAVAAYIEAIQYDAPGPDDLQMPGLLDYKDEELTPSGATVLLHDMTEGTVCVQDGLLYNTDTEKPYVKDDGDGFIGQWSVEDIQNVEELFAQAKAEVQITQEADRTEEPEISTPENIRTDPVQAEPEAAKEPDDRGQDHAADHGHDDFGQGMSGFTPLGVYGSNTDRSAQSMADIGQEKTKTNSRASSRKIAEAIRGDDDGTR